MLKTYLYELGYDSYEKYLEDIYANITHIKIEYTSFALLYKEKTKLYYKKVEDKSLYGVMGEIIKLLYERKKFLLVYTPDCLEKSYTKHNIILNDVICNYIVQLYMMEVKPINYDLFSILKYLINNQNISYFRPNDFYIKNRVKKSINSLYVMQFTSGVDYVYKTNNYTSLRNMAYSTFMNTAITLNKVSNKMFSNYVLFDNYLIDPTYLYNALAGNLINYKELLSSPNKDLVHNIMYELINEIEELSEFYVLGEKQFEIKFSDLSNYWW